MKPDFKTIPFTVMTITTFIYILFAIWGDISPVLLDKVFKTILTLDVFSVIYTIRVSSRCYSDWRGLRFDLEKLINDNKYETKISKRKVEIIFERYK